MNAIPHPNDFKPWSIILLALLAASLFQGSRGLYHTTETRYVECAREMLLQHNLLEPTLDQEPHWTKPPLVYWGINLGMVFLGFNAWGARFYLIFAFTLTVLVIYYLARYLWDTHTAPYCALVYATSLFPLAAANVVSCDTLLVLFEAAAVLFYWMAVRREKTIFLLLMWLAFALAFLTKGPPGLIPLPGIILVHSLIRSTRPGLPRLFSVPGILVFLGLGLSWYLYEAYLHPGLLRYWLFHEMYGRVATDEFRRNAGWSKPFTVYGPVLTLGAFPWIFLILGKLRQVPWSRISFHRWEFWKHHPEWFFLAVSFGIPLLIFSLSQSRLPLYVLPLFIFISLAFGRMIAWLTGKHKLRPQCITVIVAHMFMLTIIGKAAFAYMESPKNDQQIATKILASLSTMPSQHPYYLVGNRPPYGLEFYMNTHIAVIAPDEGQIPAGSLETLQYTIRMNNAAGFVPVILVQKDYCLQIPRLARILGRPLNLVDLNRGGTNRPYGIVSQFTNYAYPNSQHSGELFYRCVILPY